MKKIVLLFVGLSAVLLGSDAETAVAGAKASNELLSALSIVAALTGLTIAAVSGSISMAKTAIATITGIARNPEASPRLMTAMFVSLAMIEAQVIYTLVLALILFFGNPFIG